MKRLTERETLLYLIDLLTDNLDELNFATGECAERTFSGDWQNADGCDL